jgi:hypothetical protein
VCVADGSSVEIVPVVKRQAPPALQPLRINCGSASTITDLHGQTWQSDSDYYRGGDTTDFGEVTVSAGDGMLYATQRIGLEGYTVPLADGTYRVRLHFAELDIRCNSAGKRLFEVACGGVSWGIIDVFVEAGGLATSLVKETTVTAEGGELSIDFKRIVNEPALAGLEIIPV